MSEVLSDFKIVLDGRLIYSGKAVVVNLVHGGSLLMCEATMDEQWVDLEPLRLAAENQLGSEFNKFLERWQQTYQVLPQFKVAVADMASLFADLRLWMESLELFIRSSPGTNATEIERRAAQELSPPVLAAIDSIGDRFEEIASLLPEERRASHIQFTRRYLHPYLLCSPFAYRTFHKPLGYPGDYGMVNMIVGDPYQGDSLYSKVANAWFLNQLPAQAHRNRIKFLKQELAKETVRTHLDSRPAQVLNLGCGPAGEVQEFIAEDLLSEKAEFTLLDFNEETVQYTTNVLRSVAQRFNRTISLQVVKKSVQQLLKEAMKPAGSAWDGKYDFVYCAGLFDYLPDRVCKQLMGVFHQWLAPGGLLLVTNVDGTRPFRNKLEFILDWNLLYRSAAQMLSLKPESASPELCTVRSDDTGVNLFLQIRKQEDA